MAAIEARKVDYLDAGWSDVIVMERGQWFREWDHAHAAKRKGGRINVEVRESGQGTFHEGFVTAKAPARVSRDGDKGDAVIETPLRPAVLGPLNAIIDLHRHPAMRPELAGHGGG